MTDLILPPNGASQPIYPALNFAISPDGVMVQTIFPSGLSINQPIAAADMDELSKKWLQSRVEAKRLQKVALDVIRKH